VNAEPLPEAMKANSPASASGKTVKPESEHKAMMFTAVPDESEEKPAVEAIATAVEPEVASDEPDLPLQDQPSGEKYSDWQQAVDAFGEIKPGVSAMLDHVICVEFGSKVRLALDKHQERAIATPDRLAFAEWLGREVFWESQKDHQGESLAQERDRQARQESARLRQSAEADPHVQALISEMDAQLVKVLPAGVQPDEAS